MKEVTMFVQSTCPHCKRCLSIMDEIRAEHPEYKGVNVTIIDEKLDPVTADKYDYFYVPTFFVAGVKEHEGVPTPEAVRNVFKKACEE